MSDVIKNSQLALASVQTNSMKEVVANEKKKNQQALAHLLVLADLLMQMKEKASEPTKDTKAMSLKAPTTKPINLDTPPLPDLPPQLGNDMQAWFEALERYNELLQEIKDLGKKKNIHNMGLYIMEFMSLNMELGGAKIAQLSAADNVATDVRNMVGDALDQFNAIAGGKAGDPNLVKDAKKFTEIIDQLEAFLKYEQDLPKDKQVMGGDTVKQLLDAINTLKTPFTNYENDGKSIWNDPTAMAAAINAMGQTHGGQYDPNYKNIEDSFNTLNQSVSAFSTSTNTSLQYQTQNFKQIMGMEEAEIQSYLQETSTAVRNQRSN